jgi:hypothetical protein
MSGDGRGGVTWRALLVAFPLLVLVAIAAFYVEIAWRKVYEFGSGVPAMAPVVLLFLLAAIGGLRALRRFGLTRGELLAIYCVVLVGGPLVTHGILFWMIPKTAAYYYSARINPIWETTFLHHVPTWFAPSDPAAVEALFEGKATVPWPLWWLPLSVWSLFLLSLFVCTFCLMVLLQRQWITNERLSFPIAQIPLEMVRDRQSGDQDRAARLPVIWMFWLGLGIAFVLTFLNGLSSRVPAIPSIPLGPVALVPWQRVGPLAGLGEISLVLWPGPTAIAYLIPKELAFSAWFFWLVRLGLTVAAIAAGHAPQRPEGWYETGFPAPFSQGGGAAFALALWVLWIARHHLARALRITLGLGSRGVDAQEPLPYRWAFIGFVLSFSGMVYFCAAAGCRVIFGVLLIGLIVGYYMMWARIRAETGLGFLLFPLEIQDAIVVPFGAGVFRPREIVTMISMRWAFFPGAGETFEVCTGNTLEAFKIADSARVNSRRLASAMLTGFVLSLVIGVFIVLVGMYHYGYFSLGMGGRYGWPSWQTRNDGGRIFEYLTNPGKPDANGIIAFLAGGFVAVMLGMLRLRFWWWPFHPVGYIAANCWGMHWYYMPFFIGWACKSLVIRYGGLRLYRHTVPLAIGLIVGELLNSGVWSLVALITQGRV